MLALKTMQSIGLTSKEKKVIFVSLLGGALEFYDFIIYVLFANTLSKLFFPKNNHLTSLIIVFAVFAIGYLVRPLGGIIFGHFGDKYGRKKTFVSTLFLMALPTFFIGLIPSTQSIGNWAPFLLISLRILQGLSIGGEIPGALTFTSEHVSPKHRGLACGFIFLGIYLGLVLGSSIAALLSTLLSPAAIVLWGWRVAFILGGILGFISYYLRKNLSETPFYQSLEQRSELINVPIIDTLKNYFPQVALGVALAGLGATLTNLLLLYLPTYLTSILHYPLTTISWLHACSILIFALLLPLAGWLSDIYGRKIMLTIGAISFAIFGYLIFFLFSKQNLLAAIIAMALIILIGAFIKGVYGCALIELFPTKVRYTGMATSFNIAFGVIGGMAPLTATWLIKITNNVVVPSLYLIAAALLCLGGVFFLQNKHRQPLT